MFSITLLFYTPGAYSKVLPKTLTPSYKYTVNRPTQQQKTQLKIQQGPIKVENENGCSFLKVPSTTQPQHVNVYSKLRCRSCDWFHNKYIGRKKTNSVTASTLLCIVSNFSPGGKHEPDLLIELIVYFKLVREKELRAQTWFADNFTFMKRSTLKMTGCMFKIRSKSFCFIVCPLKVPTARRVDETSLHTLRHSF